VTPNLSNTTANFFGRLKIEVIARRDENAIIDLNSLV